MRVNRSFRTLLSFAAIIAIPSIVWTQHSTTQPFQYHLVKKIVLGGEGGWDYFTVDPISHRIYIGRGSYVMILDAEGNVIGNIDVGKHNEAHAVALAPDLHRAFTSNGAGSSVTILDPDTMKVISEVKIPERDTDDVEYEPVSKRVFTFNGGKGNDATAIDALKDVFLGRIPLGGKPETAQADGEGHLYVNVEDKSELREINANTLQVLHGWSLAPCKNPSGQAIDTKHKLLVIGCHNGLMEFWDYAKDKVAGTVPIGMGVDANRFDPGTGFAFASCSDGTITVAHEDSPEKFAVVQTIQTMRGARTMALDTGNHNIYTVSAEFGAPPPATPKNPHPWPTIKPGTFTMMIYSL